MLRRKGKVASSGGVLLSRRDMVCGYVKTLYPSKEKTNGFTSKGSEYTKFHAFVNCQDLRLTANRGSIDNTPSEILEI